MERAIEQVMQETGMGYVQAYYHVKARLSLQRTTRR